MSSTRMQMTSGKPQQSKGPGRGPVSRLSRWLRPRRTTPVTSNSQESSEDEAGSEECKKVSEETKFKASAGENDVHHKRKKGAAKAQPAEGPAEQRREHSPAERVSRVEDSQRGQTTVSEIQEEGSGDRDIGEVSGSPPSLLFKGMSLPAGFGQRQTQACVSTNLYSSGGLLQTRASRELSLPSPGGANDTAWLVAILLCTALLCLTFGGVVAVCTTALVGVLTTPLLAPSVFRKKQRKPPPLAIQDPSSKSPEIHPTPLQNKPPQRPPASEPIPSFRPRGTTPLGRRTPRPSFTASRQPTKSTEPPVFDLGEPAAVKNRSSMGSVARFGTTSVPASGQNTPQATTPSPPPLSHRSPNPLSNRSPNPPSNCSVISERDFVDLAPGVAPKWPAAAALEDDVSSAGDLDGDAAVRIAGVLVGVLASLLWSWTGAMLGSVVVMLFSVAHTRSVEHGAEQIISEPAGLLGPARAQSAPAAELGRLSRSVQLTPRGID
ncbi:hypothetical protein KFL_000680070 [Klebsormidium nitens]|uniref:Transmembrane protein n=1 Tax=Klebsormidium nitens TaxID=105231 RepID=A0A0U9HJ33_KLENI|nr:hypothetical protein KFL_000680070 [Klebsormidium nitens]|eukprot:GAQ80991.1 hypothetical protein KFL_000680070 [Klebsormidium nitens]